MGDAPLRRCRRRDGRLLPQFAGRTVFTRFVAPEHPQGAWVPYYREWPFASSPTPTPSTT